MSTSKNSVRALLAAVLLSAFALDAHGQCAIKPDALPNASLGIGYNQALVPGGGSSPYFLTVDSRTPLPPGISLELFKDAYSLAGTATRAGDYAFQINIKDSNTRGQCSVNQQFRMTVCDLVVGSLPGNGIAGEAYSGTIGVKGSGRYTFEQISGNIPLGLSLDGSSGVLSGSPKVAGRFTFRAKVTDLGTQCVAERDFTVTICNPFTISMTSLAGTIGVPFTSTVSVGNGSGSTVLSMSGTVPGLSFSGSTLSGTPTAAGAFNVIVAATDTPDCSKTTTFTLTITCPAISVRPTLPAGVAGSSYKGVVEAAGGTGPYTFSVTKGVLPSGLTLDSTGNVFGTPATPGSSTFTVAARDANGCTGDVIVTMAVECPKVGATPAALPSATVGVAYRQSVNATAGAAPHSFSITAGGLPRGLSLSADGTLAGTPAAGTDGSYAFQTTTIDANRCSGTSSHTLAVDPAKCPTVSILPATLANGKAGKPYSGGFEASGGATPYAYTVKADVPGLTFEGNKIGGTPTTAGKYVVTVAVQDANRCSATKEYTLVIEQADVVCGRIVVTPPALGPAKVNTDFRASFAASGGEAPYSFSLASGLLPPGLLLGGEVLSGRPSREGTYSFSLRVIDALRCEVIVPYSMVVEPEEVVCPTGAPALGVPANGASVDGSKPISFSWKGVAGATGYDLLTSTDEGRSYNTIATTSGESSTSANANLSAGTYLWAVRANFRAPCKPNTSDPSRLSVTAPATCPSDVATLIAPANGASNVDTTVVFQWKAVTGASEYGLLLSIDGAPSTKVATTTGTSLKFEVPNGTIVWSISAIFRDCPATVSQAFRFTTMTALTCPNTASPTLNAPADGAAGVTSPVTFSWNPVSGASAYRVLASVNGGAGQVLTTTTGTTHEASFGSGSNVLWQVEALFDGCPSTLSARRTFVVAAGSTCSTSAPALVSPANGANAVLSPVTFTWNPAKGAVSYVLYLSLDGKTFDPAAKTTETTHTQILKAPARVSWQVEAHFAGCDPARSSTSTFELVEPQRCPEGTITLNAPAVDAVVTSPVTFSWSGIAGATDYRVWASIDGAAPSVVAKSTTTSATVSIASGIVKWSVEALFASDCRSIISPASAFTVQPASTCGANQPPALVSPLGSDSAPADVSSPVELRWSATPGAIGYRVWRSVSGGAAEDFAETKGTAVTMTGEPGTYAWFVEALFAGCRPLPSTRSFFRIARTEPRCVTDAPSLINPVNGATGLSSAVTFLWREVPDAIGYRVYAAFESDGKVTDFILIGETRETSLARAIPPSSVTWFVEAVFKTCPSTTSGRSNFTIPESTNCRDEKPELITPRDGSQNVKSPVELSWSPVSGAVKYVVIAKTSVGAPTPIGETTAETAVTRHMPAGATIEWWVIAFRGGCSPVESDHKSFSVDLPPSCDARPPILQTPPERSLVTNPVQLSWTAVAGAKSYRVWALLGSDKPALIANPTATEVVATLPTGRVEWFVEATFDQCSPVRSSAGVFEVMAPQAACHPPERPAISVVGQALSDTPYGVRWAALSAVTGYELQESDTRFDFSTATTHVVQGASYKTFAYSVDAPIQKFYRARGISSCSDDRGPYSDVVGVHIVPLNANERQLPGTAEIGVQQNVVQTVFVPGSTPPVPFTARTDRPWLLVSPASGILGPEGVTFTISALPGALALGANTGTLILSYGAAGKGAMGGSKPTSVPVSISLVTPVAPTGKNTPPSEALIIPAVGHAPGANNSLFQSDVRVANTSTQSMTYQLNFTPTASDGTVTGSSTTIQIEPGGTAALNDILASFFGTGPGGAALGVLEVRPLTTSTTSSSVTSSLATATIASSRTYNVTEEGTLGQYIPAIPFSKFVGRVAGSAPSILSMQQIAQNSLYRTNLGLVEGSGQPATVLIRVFDAAGHALTEIPESLKAFEHKQLNGFIANAGLVVDDGRIEVEVTSGTGKITAYASMVDNQTNDPLLVQPVVKSSVQGTRYVIPGVAFLDGNAKWRSDVRVFNAGATTTRATITYFPQGNTAGAMVKEVTLDGGEVLALDNVLHNFFGINTSNAGGSLLVSTSSPSSLVATARTYAETENGTFGLFAPGVTPDESVALAGRSAHLLQLEDSAEYRTNIGLVETAGNSAKVELSLVLPDSKVTPKLMIDLPANGFVQFPLSGFGVGAAVYNARIAVKVISGSGRISAYGSVIDNATNDSTYVPSQ